MNRNIGKKIAQRMNADPQVQAMRAQYEFEAVVVVGMVLDLNNLRSDYRRIVVEKWCQAHAVGRWRRRVVERRGAAIRDRIVIEFELVADADRLASWLTARCW